jgi:hypothetical protein
MSAIARAAPASVATDPGAAHLDEYLPLAQAAGELPRRRGGKKTTAQCLYRWTGVGCRGVKMRYTQVGATRCTTRRWLAEFFAALTAGSTGAPAAAPVRTTAARAPCPDTPGPGAA